MIFDDFGDLIFDSFLDLLFEGLLAAPGSKMAPKGVHFGSLLGSFFGHLRKVKIELSPKRELHFYCPRGTENHCFFEILSERPPEHPPGPKFARLGPILCRFWGPPGT